ncbi:MAG: D-amino acid dehydrogenase [Verrucomicrobia subdivision 3 bacterium]|nr:D-amino acid dehydrogenase [Limisphaerales bacterium]MCS1412645.1 D-amino acid dehydrogenase [Limisphaerales bacterium]
MARTDSVIIVGGGVVGIACAHYLFRAGYRVTVIEKGRLAGACSHGNCGFVCPSHVLPLTEPGAVRAALKSLLKPNAPFRVRPRLSPALWHWMWQFARCCRREPMLRAGVHLKAMLDSSMREYRHLVDDENLHCEWQEEGLLYVLRTEKGVQDFGRNDDLLTKEFGIAARSIEGKDLSEFEPALRSDLAGAFFYEGDTHLRPDLLNRSWGARLREEGVRFVTGCELQQVRKEGQRVFVLQTAGGEMRADHYVFAMGAWSSKLGRELRCPIPVEPGKGYSVTMRRPSICPTHPMLFPEHKVGVTPFKGEYRLGSMMEFAGFDATIPEKRIRQLRTSAEVYLLEPHTSGTREEWFGWRPMTWDSLPIVGRVPRLGNAFLATGHNMLGLSLAPATGRLVAEILSGEAPHIDASPFSPSRFL